MIGVLRIGAAAVATLVIAGGCASPPSRFYALSATSERAAAPLDVSVAVGPVFIPATVDATSMMLQVGPNEVRPDDYHRWAAPLAEDLSRTVASDLAALLGSDRVTLASRSLATAPEYRASVEVRRFESALGRAATLEAIWTVRRTADNASAHGSTLATERADGADYTALVAAHSRAVGRLSGDIAAAVRGLAAR